MNKRISQVGMIFFLLLIVAGFSIPGFIDSEKPIQYEPRICKVDNDCTLLCDNEQLLVMCLQNLCQQDTCKQESFYPFIEKPIQFKLDLQINNTKINLNERSNSGNTFVSFNNQQVFLFTKDLSLNNILEKVNILIENSCVIIDNKKICSENPYIIQVNNINKTEIYYPKQDDIIKITV